MNIKKKYASFNVISKLAYFHYLVEYWKNLWNCRLHLSFEVYSISIFGFNYGHGRKSCSNKYDMAQGI